MLLINYPLKHCLKIDIGTNKEILLLLRYERLPDHCFHCGMLGHTLRECVEATKKKRDVDQSFGAWLRASSPTKSRPSWFKRLEKEGTVNQAERARERVEQQPSFNNENQQASILVEDQIPLASSDSQEEDNIKKGKQNIGGKIIGVVVEQNEMTVDLRLNSETCNSLSGQVSINENYSPSILELIKAHGDSIVAVIQQGKESSCSEPNPVGHEPAQQIKTNEVANAYDNRDGFKNDSDSAIDLGKRTTWKRRARGFNDTQSIEVENSQSGKRTGDSDSLGNTEGKKK
ncbi:hypothetical protein ACOSP7_020066 [Xanthoceras sorbifolium]